ncbi:MAG: hypothetical protein DRJ47_10295, partial [Thermoprotei archaeon]
MKSKLISLAVASLLLITLLSPLSISAVPHQTEPQNPPPGTGAAMWIEPRTINFDTSTVSVGYKFNVTVFIRTNRSATAWQFQLYYDNNYFKAIRCGYAGDPSYVGASGQSMFFKGLSTIGVEPAFTPGGVLHGESLLTGTRDPEPNGAALSWIEFEVIAVPGKGETVSFELDIATAYPEDTYYIGINPDTQVEEKSPMEVYNTLVTFTWSPPPSPYLGIEPTSRFYDRYTQWVGTTFTEDIYIKELSSAWYLVNASFMLTYNDTFLEVIDVTLNPDWNVKRNSGFNAILSGTDRLLALQSDTDFGWDWIVTGLTEHSAANSSTNLYGVIALGLLDAYELTGNTSYFDAAKNVADFIMYGNASEGDFYYGWDGYYWGFSFDYRFLVRFSEVSGNTTYRDYAIDAWNWVKENRGEYYGDGNQTALYNYMYAHYGTHGGAIWQSADFALAALACGDTAWARNMAEVIRSNLTKIDEADGYKYIGWGKALELFEAVDPTTYAAEISAVIGNLTDTQNAEGFWDTTPDADAVQNTAYAIMGLMAVGEVDPAVKGAKWLISTQLENGGWGTPEEISEVDSEAVQALCDVMQGGRLLFYVETNKTLSGDVLVGTVTFNITMQGEYPTVYESPLTFANAKLCDHTLQIPLGPSVPGLVTVEGYLTVHMPHLEVVPNEVVFGPEPVVGEEFTVSVDIKRLHFAWKLIGVQFRMTYCDDMLEVVKVEEGDFFEPYAPYGTFFCSYVEPDYYGPHILVGTLILPNATGCWDQFPPYPGAESGEPGENGTIAKITFKIVKQLGPENLTCAVNLFDIVMIDVEGKDVPFESPVNGTYTCLGISYMTLPRMLDVYGGAVNRGYGSIPFPAPHGGQGNAKPMDMVIAQSEVTLFAKATYNNWPEVDKIVAFEIIDPYGNTWAKLSAKTNRSGIATVTFRMPWNWTEDATKYFGEWTVVASSEIADVLVMDYLWFKYDYLVNIWNVTTDKYEYKHLEPVNIEIELGT